ncbi:hypothetical protein FJQ98_12380 [Lysinibacillus agricola]|uniref:Uncharacterized protein n=1 Tax=Lysinibacillus agricola TaxID=2590012 RepID=A0ABX7AZ05_9BACI|nr:MULTISPECIES: hypothetical protein [Lysinibacillus]KOS64417.1 hypothetical protein AN161_02330 [Lysinibacillus sp. FJAT-14222]QQP14722.1 hypothetical protein FJQ98_12380 [Lysinibacillus agricola]
MTNIHVCTAQESQYVDMEICKQPRTEVAKKATTRMVVESLVDQLLASNLISNERLFDQIFYNKDIIWIQNESFNGHLFAKANITDQLKTKTNDFMMYMPTNPIVYEVNGEHYHLITRIDSTRAKPNLERLSQVPKAILSAARVNDLLCSIVMRFYETYLEDLSTSDEAKQENAKLINFVEREFKQFLQAVSELNDYHLNWHPRGNGHELLLELIDNLQLLKSRPGKVIIDFSNAHGYIVVEPSYRFIKQDGETVQAL